MCDATTGECVHVDFDCLFDKGMSVVELLLHVYAVVKFHFESFVLTRCMCRPGTRGSRSCAISIDTEHGERVWGQWVRWRFS